MRLFVSENYLKTITPTAGNIDVAELLPHVAETQDRMVQELLGSKFYNELIDDNHVLTADETALVYIIRPYLAWYIVYDALPFIHYKLKPKGLVKMTNDTSTPSELTELKYIREEVKNKAEQYGQRLQDYLWDNRLLFNSYKNFDCPLAPDTSTTFTSDVAFDNEEWNDKSFTSSRIRKYLYGI